MNESHEVYKLAIRNTRTYIKSEENVRRVKANDDPLTLFNASMVLAVVFCKSADDVYGDLLFME